MRLRLFVADEYKPLHLVSWQLWLLTFAAFFSQIAFDFFYVPPPKAEIADLLPPPSESIFRFSSFGEEETLAKVEVLQLQSFDNQSGVSVPFAEINYDVLGEWLDRIVALDPRAEYPHFLMAKVYSSTSDKSRKYKAATWTRKHFLQAPDARWEWMVHMTNVMRYIIKDEDKALEMAREIRENTTPGKVPSWVRQIEAFFYDKQDEFQAAAVLFESQLTAGEVTEAHEFKFSRDRLEKILKKMFNRGDIGAGELKRRLNKLDKLTDKFLQQHEVN